MSCIVCFFLIALALRGWVASKKNAAPASAGVVEVEVPVASATSANATNGPIVVHDRGGTVRYQSSTSKAPVVPRNPYVGR